MSDDEYQYINVPLSLLPEIDDWVRTGTPSLIHWFANGKMIQGRRLDDDWIVFSEAIIPIGSEQQDSWLN